MHYAPVLLGLVASVAALDIRLYKSVRNCGGNGYEACTNMNPNQCCSRSNSDSYLSVGFTAIPTGWTLDLRGHNGGNCNNWKNGLRTAGVTDACLSNGGYSGGGYGFAGKKRDILTETSGPCVAPDTLVLADGTQFNIAGASDADYEQLLSLMDATVEAIPEKFDALKLQ